MKYEVWFKLVDEDKGAKIDFTDETYLRVILKAIDNFNNAGDNARNKKRICNKSIEPSIIKIWFESDIELEKPTKCFRYFSKDLIDNSQEFSDLAIGGRLLKGVYARVVTDEEESLVLSDEQMITKLLHWCMTKEIQDAEDKKNKRITIDKIKALIVECETLSQ